MLYEKFLPEVKGEYGNFKEPREDERCTHDMRHISSVIETCERVCKLFKIDEKQTDDIKIAALLHDVGVSNIGKKDHAERSYIWATNYLSDKPLSDESKTQILDAIRYHSKGINTLYSRILTFADKIDVTEKRVLPFGRKEHGLKQYVHIKTIDFAIKGNILNVIFKTDGKMDVAEANEYYFTPKIFAATRDIANFFFLEHNLYVDDKIWELTK